MLIRWLRNEDGGVGDGVPIEAPVAEVDPAAESAVSSTPVPQAPAAPDYSERLSQYEKYFSDIQEQIKSQNEKYQSQYQQLQNVMLQTFAPEQYQRMSAPRYVTADQFQRQMQEFQEKTTRQAQAAALAERYQSEISLAKEKFPDLFETPEAEMDIEARWVRGNKSVLQIAKELHERQSKAFEKWQAKFAAQKKEVAESVKGSPGAGGVPDSKPQSTGRGFGRLSALRKALGGD